MQNLSILQTLSKPIVSKSICTFRYYAFGSSISTRGIGNYRYGFNTQEKDDEVSGEGNSYTAEFWQYDSRLGIRWNKDPVVNPSISSYSTNEDNPIKNNDPKGDCPTCPNSPQLNIGIGLTLGTHNNGVVLNASISQQIGNWNLSAGFGAIKFSTFSNTGKSGFELRYSIQGGYNDGVTSLSLGTNVFRGLGEMSEFKQRTGILNYGFKDFSFSYENDGAPFQKNLFLQTGDGADRYRTAAVRIGLGDFSAGFNLFTGSRTIYDGDKKEMSEGLKTGNYDVKMPNGFVLEDNTPYRMGAAYLGYGDFKFGIDSDRWIRHPIQDNFAHNIPGKRQPGFETLSKTVKPYVQVRTTPKSTAPNFSLYIN